MKAGRAQKSKRKSAVVSSRGRRATRTRTGAAIATAPAEAAATTEARTDGVRAPERTCVACRKPGGREDLVRMVEGPDGRIAVDLRARSGGRGAWVHPTRGCLGAAAKRHAVERSLKVPVREVDEATLFAEVAAGMRRKIESLFGAARRKGAVAIGAEAASEALERARVPLVLVASDAGANSRGIADDEAAGGPRGGVTVREYGTRSVLGAVLGRGEVAIAAVTDLAIAVELTTTMDRLAGVEG